MGSGTDFAITAFNGNHTHEIGGHTHSIPAHTHSIAAHSHAISAHTHAVQEHTHAIAGHTHLISTHTHLISSHTHAISNHDHSIPAHSHSISAHTHTVAAHTHSIAAHTHSIAQHTHSLSQHVHSLNNHTHSLQDAIIALYGIFREEAANTFALSDLEYRVNTGDWTGLETSTDVGDGWRRLDITTQVQNSVTLRPVQTNNTLQIRRKTAGATEKTGQIDAQLSVRNIIQSVALL
jgi:hypothetical protein